MTIRTDIPPNNERLRSEIYQGAVFRMPPTAISKRLVSDAVCLIEEHLGKEPRLAQFQLTHNQFANAVSAIKKNLNSEHFRTLQRHLQLDIGFDCEKNAFDALRFRAVPHGAHETANSAPAYIYHRDTWFANSQSQINWWIPLYEVSEAETFSLYPDHFTNPISNSSGNFEYDKWSVEVGFNNSYANPAKAAQYPTVQTSAFDTGKVLTFSAAPGDIILFSGAHLHRTNYNTARQTRFSIDFRTVNLEDHNSDIGAPNVDNQSRGDATQDFCFPFSEFIYEINNPADHTTIARATK